MKKYKNIIMIVLGVACDAFGTAAFVLPLNFLAGGITGLGRVFTHYFGFDISYVVGVISIILLIIGWVTLGKKFAMSIILGSILFPVFLNLYNRSWFLTHMTTNAVLAAIFGGIMMGIGLGLIIKAGASSGGSDVIPVILNRKLGWPVAPMMYIVDFSILLLQLPFADIEEVLFGVLVILICTITLNKVVLIGSSDVQFTIISQKYEEINQAIQDLDVGSTITYGETGHLHDKVNVIICIVSHEGVHNVKDAVLKIDPEAFMTMVNVSGVNGRGFTMPRRYWE